MEGLEFRPYKTILYNRGTVKAFLDGEEIESVDSGTHHKVVEFNFTPGSRLSISEHGAGIIQFNSLEIIDCHSGKLMFC